MLIVVGFLVVLIRVVVVDGDAAGVAAADPGTDGGGIAACADDGERGHLRNIDVVALGVRCDGVRTEPCGIDSIANLVSHPPGRYSQMGRAGSP